MREHQVQVIRVRFAGRLYDVHQFVGALGRVRLRLERYANRWIEVIDRKWKFRNFVLSRHLRSPKNGTLLDIAKYADIGRVRTHHQQLDRVPNGGIRIGRLLRVQAV